jgi:hypothetical protein
MLFICPNQPHIRPFLVRFEVILPTAYRFGVIQPPAHTYGVPIFLKRHAKQAKTHMTRFHHGFQKTRADMILL